MFIHLGSYSTFDLFNFVKTVSQSDQFRQNFDLLVLVYYLKKMKERNSDSNS